MSADTEWDEAAAAELIGKRVLAAIMTLAPDGSEESFSEFHGVIEAVDLEGITVACEGEFLGEKATLPADLRGFEAAEDGVYTMNTTGEQVEPDLVTVLTVHRPAD